MQQKHWIRIAFALFICVVWVLVSLSFFPSSIRILRVEGDRHWASHKPFSEDNTVAQTFRVHGENLSRIDVTIVDFTGHSHRTPITLTITEEVSGTVLRTATLSYPNVTRDSVLSFPLSPFLPTSQNELLRFTLSAPKEERTTPYAVRVSKDDAYQGGIRFQEQLPFEKTDISFSLFRRDILARALWVQFLENPHEGIIIFSALFAAGTLALLFVLTEKNPRAGLLLSLLFLLFLGLMTRGLVISHLRGESGGDVYNYLSITKSLVRGDNPFANTIRLPVYPLLLTPALLHAIPDIFWGRVVSIFFALGTILLLFPLASLLRLRLPVALCAAMLLCCNKDFFFTSLRPLPYSVYAFLLLLSIITLFRIRTYAHAIAWGTLLGIMGMTRQEAFLPIAILTVTFFFQRVREKSSPRQLFFSVSAVGVPLLLLLGPYFFHNYIETGNPLHTPYFDNERLQPPRSLHGFLEDNLGPAWGVLSSTWRPLYGDDVRVEWGGSFSTFFVSICTLVLLRLFSSRVASPFVRYGVRIAWALWSVLFVGIFLWTILHHNGNFPFMHYTNDFMLSVMLLGIPVLVFYGRWKGMLLLILLVSQWMIATWFHPFAKHYQQSWPLFALGMAIVLCTLVGMRVRRTVEEEVHPYTFWQWVNILPLAFLLPMLFVPVFLDVNSEIDRYNASSASAYVLDRAASYTQTHGGNIVADADYFEVYYYLEGHLFPFLEDNATPEQQMAFLERVRPRYLLITNLFQRFTLQNFPSYAPFFTQVGRFVAEGKDEKKMWSELYEVHLPSY